MLEKRTEVKVKHRDGTNIIIKSYQDESVLLKVIGEDYGTILSMNRDEWKQFYQAMSTINKSLESSDMLNQVDSWEEKCNCEKPNPESDAWNCDTCGKNN